MSARPRVFKEKLPNGTLDQTHPPDAISRLDQNKHETYHMSAAMNQKRISGRTTFVAWMAFALVVACNQGSNREVEQNDEASEAVQVAQDTPTLNEPDWSNPGDVALHAVQAYQTRNLVALAALAIVDQQQALSTMEPGTPEFEEFFDPEESWQIRAIHRFEGEIQQCRIDELRARCQFAETDREEPAVVTLMWESDQWRYASINRPDSFSIWGTVWDGTNPQPVATDGDTAEGTGEMTGEGTGEGSGEAAQPEDETPATESE